LWLQVGIGVVDRLLPVCSAFVVVCLWHIFNVAFSKSAKLVFFFHILVVTDKKVNFKNYFSLKSLLPTNSICLFCREKMFVCCRNHICKWFRQQTKNPPSKTLYLSDAFNKPSDAFNKPSDAFNEPSDSFGELSGAFVFFQIRPHGSYSLNKILRLACFLLFPL